ncbi:MAG: TetR/AcrR family transcriptional regulator [Micromonosporaceae bacterium]|nr:TetR/AcrR family transcriptional regulator [Micromonosporaceae bacterium]
MAVTATPPPAFAPRRQDGRLLRGERTRTAVLDAAVALATEQGLDGLSLAQLADRLGVSKSGLFAHWRSKEELQLAAVERAREQWIEQVVSPALRAPRGVRRLWALHEAKLAFYAAWVLPGGCFFVHSGFEYSQRPGPVRDRLIAVLSEWLDLIERLVREAMEAGELDWPGDPGQLAFEIDAAGMAMVYMSRLFPPDAVHRRARAAVLTRLRALCPDPALLPEA